MKEYIPAPLDTNDVELPAELYALSEKIAENVHEVWAAGRMAEGWVYGPEKDSVGRAPDLRDQPRPVACP